MAIRPDGLRTHTTAQVGCLALFAVGLIINAHTLGWAGWPSVVVQSALAIFTAATLFSEWRHSGSAPRGASPSSKLPGRHPMTQPCARS